ncbi:maleylacetoacetate isomerase [Actimicrobium antarcticum]|uniref:Maleylacetoacetate isomerase n=1 Tax=Actimicrobium antarcticum TaxID=1051899 RepID=A0ABP7SKA9_9BURK
MLKLHTYFRSSASFRVRIALNLKGLAYDTIPVHLLADGGQQKRPQFRSLNPMGLVPVLQDGPETVTQSLAIIEYLEELHPEPTLLGRSTGERARIRAVALDIACEIHPLNNLRVLNFLVDEFGFTTEQKKRWYQHWVETGLAAVEATLMQHSTDFCIGDTPTLADCCLVPQVFNAMRFDCNLAHVPRVVAIHDHCMTLDAFRRAAPGDQPDAA